MNTTKTPVTQKTSISPPNARVLVGKEGERAAAVFLLSKGYEILDLNWRPSSAGEIDIVATKGHRVVFVEVKTRRYLSADDALAAVDDRKLARLVRLGAQWMHANRCAWPYRFDVIGVQLREGREPLFEWLQDVAA